MRRGRALLAGLSALLALGAARPAAAQQYGQWSWDAAVTLGQQFYRNSEFQGVPGTSYQQTTGSFSLGLTGYAFDPAIVGFHLGGDVYVGDYRPAATERQVGFGGSASINILPRSILPITAYASRRKYDYSGITTTDPLALLTFPQWSTAYGGRARVRRGFLGGLLLGYDRNEIEFVDSTVPRQVNETMFGDWSGNIGRMVPHLRIERRFQDYGYIDYRSTDWTATFDQHGPLWKSWRWDLSAVGFRRDSVFGVDQDPTRVDSMNLVNSFSYTTARNDSLNIGYSLGVGRTPGVPTGTSQNASLSYAWNIGSGFTATPTASYYWGRFGDSSNDGPQAALNVGWNRQLDAWAISLNANGSYYDLKTTTPDASGKDSGYGWGGGFYVAHGTEATLLKSVEASYSRNQIQQVAALTIAPGTGLYGIGPSTRATGRVSVSKAGGRSRFRFYVDGSQQEATQPTDAATTYTVRSVVGVAEIGYDWATASGSWGKSKSTAFDTQNVKYWSASLNLRPSSNVTAIGTYRRDQSEQVGTPDVDSWRGEATLSLRFGEFFLGSTAFYVSQVVPGSDSNLINRGLTWTLTRGFSGWLPFVSSQQRRGVVR